MSLDCISPGTMKTEGLYFVLLVVIALHNCQAQTRGYSCHSCDRTTDVNACDRKKTCRVRVYADQPQSTENCALYIERVGKKIFYTKSCKQASACTNEGSNPDTNCDVDNLEDKGICRCCCKTKNCNKGFGCQDTPDCFKPSKIKNGQYKCEQDKMLYGTQCSYECDKGFEMKGPATFTCTENKGDSIGSWLPKPGFPECIVRCNPERTDPENGKVTCKNAPEYADKEEKNYKKSKCTFICDSPYYRKGSRVNNCLVTGKWDNAPPTCELGECYLIKKMKHRTHTCTNKNFFGSICSFKCDDGFIRVGSETVECLREAVTSAEGRWSPKEPTCVQIKCSPERSAPENGKVTCTNTNWLGSVCTFKCKKGYDLDDTTEASISTTCSEDNDLTDDKGKWEPKVTAKCSPIICRPPLSLDHGKVNCDTKDHALGTECKFTCNKGYDLEGTIGKDMASICEESGNNDDLGVWSVESAVCVPITCDPPRTDPENGKSECTKSNLLDSVCSFKCDQYFDLVGTKKPTLENVCKDAKDGTAKGKWSAKPATCQPILCPVISSPKNGLMMCTAENFASSICTFTCDSGFEIVGYAITICNDDGDGDDEGDWSHDPPSCVDSTCVDQVYNPNVLNRVCKPNKGFTVGTTCVYTCKLKGRYMTTRRNQNEALLEGKLSVTCYKNKTWSDDSPLCFVVTCKPALKAPLPGGNTPLCTNKNNYKSKCTYSCQEGWDLIPHKRPLTCNADADYDEFGEWSEDPPSCKYVKCAKFPAIVNGYLTCTNDTFIGSRCDLTCQEGYIIKKYENVTCMDHVSDPVWNRKKTFVCCAKCEFNPDIQVAFVVDKTAAQTQHEWYGIEDFVLLTLQKLVKFNFEVITSFALVEKQVVNSVAATKVINFDQISAFLDPIRKMKYGGRSSSLAAGLTFANNVMYEKLDSSRENYVVIITSKQKGGDAFGIAKTIRDRGINILAAGMNIGKQKISSKYLEELTGDPGSVLTISSTQDLTRFTEQITGISVKRGCSDLSKDNPCSK